MAFETISTDQFATYTIDIGDDVTLLPGVNVTVATGNGFENALADTISTTLRIDGTVVAISGAVRLDSTDAVGFGNHSVTVGSNGVVHAPNFHGIQVAGDGSSVVNYGEVSGITGVFGSEGDIQVANHGKVSGTVDGIAFVSSDQEDVLAILNTGTITAEDDTIHTFSASLQLVNTGLLEGFDSGDDGMLFLSNSASAARSLIINSGTIASTSAFAINANFMSAGLDLVNTGLIIGDVDMSDFTGDTFDGRGGTVIGEVRGGAGDDIYIIDDAGIVLVENAAEGTDEVRSEVSFALADNFENLTLLGADDINGTGNAVANAVTGNAGNNRLVGGGGADVVKGESGDDVIGGSAGADFLYGGDGNDTLGGGQGNDQIFGQSDEDVLIGRAGDDRLFGGNGDDLLIGGLGADLMDGEAGADEFKYLNVADSGFGAAADRITGFTVGEDRINLSNLAGDPFDIAIGGPLTGTGPSVSTAAIGPNTDVFVDVDGDGAADMQIRVIGTLGLTEAEFIL